MKTMKINRRQFLEHGGFGRRFQPVAHALSFRPVDGGPWHRRRSDPARLLARRLSQRHDQVLSGKVDLGTGVETALAQIVAQKMDVPFDRVHMMVWTQQSDQPGHDRRQPTVSLAVQSCAKPLPQRVKNS